MQFAKLLAIGSSFVVATLAQSRIAFTTLPGSVQAGVPTVLRWTGGEPDSVSLQSRRTIAIPLTGDVACHSYSETR